jgi:hypothetical protein
MQRALEGRLSRYTINVTSGFKPTHVLALILLLIPSAAFLWRNSDMPQFGDIHDDSLYYVSAKSLAAGDYRIESLPERPFQTKYPPLYPLLLSVAWRVNPNFPQNLPLAGWISWLAMPLMLALLAALYPRMGIAGWRSWLLLTMLALNPYVILFSSRLLSELWFTALLAGVLLLVEKAAKTETRVAWAIAAALLAGLAYLLRSAGIVLLGSGFVYLWLRGQRRKAWVFAAVMFPFVAAWTLWARLHQLHTDDPALVYYTDYFRYEIYNVNIHNLHLVLWKNLDGLVSSLGYLILPNVTSSLFMKILAELIGVGMISGIVRMVRGAKATASTGGTALHYTIFAAGAAFMLVIWHFPPNERFVLPLAPLAFAGLLTEMEHFVTMARAGLKHREASQRVAAAVMLSLAALLFAGAAVLQAYVGGVFLGETANEYRTRNIDYRGAFAWIRANLPQDASVIAYNDPVLYLYTGRHSISRPLPPYIWYSSDHARAVELYRGVAPYALQHGVGYVYYTTKDMRRDMDADDVVDIETAIRSNPRLTPVFRYGIGTIYRVDGDAAEPLRPSTAYTTAPATTITSPGQVVAGR